jgi:hypothetical protein
MKLSAGKIVLGATLAVSLGAFTFPAGASIPSTTQQRTAAAKKGVGIQLAQVTVEQKADEKADEVKNEATGAKDAVVAAHREHEADEALPHTMTGKAESKVNEGKNEVTGAANAVESAHDQHEAQENAEGRN